MGARGCDGTARAPTSRLAELGLGNRCGAWRVCGGMGDTAVAGQCRSRVRWRAVEDRGNGSVRAAERSSEQGGQRAGERAEPVSGPEAAADALVVLHAVRPRWWRPRWGCRPS